VNSIKPKPRSRLRIAVGSLVYTLLRYLKWCINSGSYAKSRSSEYYPVVVFEHKTPLIRKLKDVEMWLQYNKVTNLQIAVKYLDGIIIQPGETFSYWKLLGKPTCKKGYVEGMILHYGKFKSGIGGGLCQLSNLIYWMTLHTPLTVIERHRHSYDVFPDADRTQPFGSGATCFYNYLDLQIKNNTGQPYQLHLYLTDSHLHGEWRTVNEVETRYEVYEQKHWITQEIWGGYLRHNIICRRVLDSNGEIIKDEYVTENHAIMMYQPFLTEGNN